jgi:hypothetical protein
MQLFFMPVVVVAIWAHSGQVAGYDVVVLSGTRVIWEQASGKASPRAVTNFYVGVAFHNLSDQIVTDAFSVLRNEPLHSLPTHEEPRAGLTKHTIAGVWIGLSEVFVEKIPVVIELLKTAG